MVPSRINLSFVCLAFVYATFTVRKAFLPADSLRNPEYYIEARYPVGVTTLFQPAILETDLRIAQDLTALIRDKTNIPRIET